MQPKTLLPFVLLFAASAIAAGCGGGKRAEAVIQAASGSTLTGAAVFESDGNLVTFTVSVSGAPPGSHGLHVHEKGDCSAMDGTSAGPHWNPGNAMHGNPAGGGAHHLGDTGNFVVNADGTGTHGFSTSEWTIGSETSTLTDVVGRAVIIHANPDDFSQPAGNAGPRIGCGVINLRP